MFENKKYEEMLEIYDKFSLNFDIDFETILKSLIDKDNTKLAYKLIKKWPQYADYTIWLMANNKQAKEGASFIEKLHLDHD